MSVYSLRARIGLPLLLLSAALTPALAQTTITTIPTGGGTFTTGFSIIGETFTTPTDNVLNSFAFQMDDLGPLKLTITPFDSTTGKETGPAVFTSASTAAGTVSGANGYNFSTGQLDLISGDVYAALLSGSNGYGGPIVLRAAPGDAYTGGHWIAANLFGGTYFAPFEPVYNSDLAFTAKFSPAATVPEGSSLALFGSGLLLPAAFLRRRKAAAQRSQATG